MRRLLVLGLVLSACSLGGQSAGDPVTTTSRALTPTSTTTTGGSSPSATAEGPIATTTPALISLGYETVATGIPFPVGVESLPDDPRLFIVSKTGQISVLPPGQESRVFLDIADLVRNQGEQGLLGLAFHPDYANNGRFFVHYSASDGDTNLVEYRVSDDPERAEPDPVRTLLHVDQPAPNHNGGQLSFGPDGYLYLGLGDGGGANDQFDQGQRTDTLLGALLRLDVDSARPYTIPPDNPFASGVGGAPQVWAYGLRNPWRFSFDEGSIYIGDVGQQSFEEINVAPSDKAGVNYGWPITEGLHCFRPLSDCDTSGLTLPVLEISHADSGTCSLTGGVVYRGVEIPELFGHYLYADFCGGYLRSFRYDGSEAVDHADWTDQVSRVESVASFGVDAGGEVYVAVRDGRILRLVARR